MLFEEALFSELKISDIVGSKIYPIIAPEGAGSPFIVWVDIAQTYSHQFGNDSGYSDRYIQFDIYHSSHLEVRNLAKLLRNKLINFTGLMGGSSGISIQSVTIENEHSSYENGVRLYRIIQEYKFTYIEEVN